MRTLEVEEVPFDLAAAGLALVVIDTRAPHAHVDGEYAERRRSCERAAEILGVPALRDVTVDDLDAALARLGDGADGGPAAQAGPAHRHRERAGAGGGRGAAGR